MLILLLTACTSAPAPTSSTPPPTTPTGTPPVTTPTTTPTANAVTIDLVAQNIAFNTNKITVPAGAEVTVNFNNKDSVPHNLAVYNDSSATAPAIFQGQIVAGPGTVTYKFTAPSTAGTYFFRCDVHPTLMTGSFVVQ